MKGGNTNYFLWHFALGKWFLFICPLSLLLIQLITYEQGVILAIPWLCHQGISLLASEHLNIKLLHSGTDSQLISSLTS